MEHFAAYFHALQAANLAEITEHSLRPELKNLLSAVAAAVDANIAILHEGKREGKFGAPDFKITRVENIIGYVENKKVGEPLDKIIKSDQIKKYRQLSDNILITNYLEWVWLNNDNLQRETLCELAEIDKKQAKLDPQRIAAVEALLRGFFSFAPEGIGKPKALAEALAIRGKILKEFLDDELCRQSREDVKGKLLGLYQTFQKYIFNELTVTDFADTFSQNLIYGLFLAKLNADTTAITLQNAELFISANFELIRELVEFLKVLQRKEYADIRWVVEEILTILNTMNLRDITIALSFTRTDADSDDPYAAKDPYVYFYEDFLAAYDKALRKAKGVYYTPPQVVNFIVRAVDDTLRETFSLPDGLADHERVTVLDFATGTGTFLLEVMRQILQKSPSASERTLLIREHILKNLYGFEYLIAPYTIAHLKLSQFLKDSGYALDEEERVQIFLTNTLEPVDRQISIPLLPALTEETRRAQHVKDRPILVITGNPPYAGHSRNKGTWMRGLLKDYTKHVPELRKPAQAKWLQDDYVKFIRFAQWKMEQVDEGIVAIITNHSFLDNPTFCGMRHSLMQTFHQLYFLDLHGNVKKKETSPTGGKDENVFDIEQGVAISLFVKRKNIERKVFHADFYGTRAEKYQQASQETITSVSWQEIQPQAPNFLFIPQNQTAWNAYQEWMSIPSIFGQNGDPAPGIVTTHDEFAISFTQQEAFAKIETFLRTESEAEARQQFRLCSQNQWNYQHAKSELVKGAWKEQAVTILFRPFDLRWTIWNSHVAVHRRERVMQHLLRPNLGLIAPRQSKQDWGAFIAAHPIGHKAVCAYDINYVFPLYLYKQEDLLNNGNSAKHENFSFAFRQFIDERYGKHYAPEEIFGYIYAMLYSPTYRAKYAEFLKIDFPRLPFPETREAFEQLSNLGWQLIQAHLLKEIPAYNIGQYAGDGNNEVVKPDYRKYAEHERLYINATQYFDHVPEAVYRFQVGGYQVLDKYLKDRKDRALTLSDVKTLRNTIKALAFTLEQMQQIDDATKEWI